MSVMTEPDDARLDRLVDLVVQLASGDLAARMQPSQAADSVDAVIVGVNMLADELQVLYSGLEERVAERTAMLEQAQAELQHLALIDALTGLANRTLFDDRVEQAIARSQRGAPPPAVLLVDLDGFKTINDNLGHAAGDAVLVHVARRLQAIVRVTDTVARLGGDEFAVLICDATPSGVLALAQRALAAIRMPIHLGDRVSSVGASIGLSTGSLSLGARDLLPDADTAMYAAKARGRNNIAVFEPAMHSRALLRMSMSEDLRAALPTGDFLVHYQPLVELATGRIVGVEALARWRHPKRGFVPPTEFIAIAQETGLIGELGRRVTEQAVRQFSHWQRDIHLPFGLHVNVSPQELGAPDLASTVRSTLKQCGVPATSLTLDISEAGLAIDDDDIARTLDALRASGVGLAVDDFGSGHLSIRKLRRLPVGMVKIDGLLDDGLGADPQQLDLVRAMVQLIDSVGQTVVAENVETAAEAGLFQRLGFRYGQGYYFQRPIPAAEMTEALRADQSRPGRQRAVAARP